MILSERSHSHLLAHHGDFAHFAQLMVDTHQRRFDPVFWGFVEKHLGCDASEVKQVVDLGTGPALLLPDLAERYTHARVAGVEAQPEMLARARDILEALREEKPTVVERLQLVHQDLHQPPLQGLEDHCADLVVSSMVVHELLNPTVFMDEVVRLLKPGGVLIVYDWVRQPLRSYFDDERPTTLDQFTHFSEHCRYTPEDVAWLFQASGLEVKEWMARHNGRHALFAAQLPVSD
jgi:SAM-dependent methyltransferase